MKLFRKLSLLGLSAMVSLPAICAQTFGRFFVVFVGAETTGNQRGGTANYTTGDAFPAFANVWLREGSADAPFIHGPTHVSSVLSPDRISPGTHTFFFFASYDNAISPAMMLNIHLDLDPENRPDISAYSLISTTSTAEPWHVNTGSSPYPMNNPSGTVEFAGNGLRARLTDFRIFAPAVFAIDRVGYFDTSPDGKDDYTGQFTVEVTKEPPIPEPGPIQMLPNGGLFTNRVDVALSGLAGAAIRFTLDKSEPTTTSTLYTTPIRLTTATTIKAKLFFNGFPVSEVVSAVFARVYALDDGVSADWRRRYFGDGYLTDPRVSASADPDSDGASNLQEYVAGSDPLDPLSGFAVKVQRVPSIIWVSVPGKSYRVLRKAHLADVDWTVVKQVTATGESSRFTDEEVADDLYFYSIEPVR